MLDIAQLHQQLCEHKVSRPFRLSILRKLTRQQLFQSNLEQVLQQVFETKMTPAELLLEFPQLAGHDREEWKSSLHGLIRNVCSKVH